jgi:hypothetical protein
MLQELRRCRAGALLLVVVALFSCLAPVLGARPDTGAGAVRPGRSGLTTIPPPETQPDMGPPMAPDPGGVTMALPEAQIREKGGPVPDDAQLELSAGAQGDLKEQNGASGATDSTGESQLDPAPFHNAFSFDERARSELRLQEEGK